MTLPSRQMCGAGHGVGVGEDPLRTQDRSRIELRTPQAVVTAGCWDVMGQDVMGQAIIEGTHSLVLLGMACEPEAARCAALARE